MIRLITLLMLVFLVPTLSSGQNLLKERIWKISSRKRSIFFDKGVFHSDLKTAKQNLMDVRNSYIPARGYERIVFDFSSTQPPRVYGHIAKESNKLYIDFFDVKLAKKMNALDNIKYLERIDFFDVTDESLSAELKFKHNVSFDIFYLNNPGRVVIDVKK